MLTSQLGIRLQLWLGQTVPRPASYDVMNALTQVQVTNDAENGDGFSITFTLSKGQMGEYRLLQSGIATPFTRVIIGVFLGVSPEVLIDGVITHHQLAPSNEPGQSTLTVMGRDISQMMNLEERNRSFKQQRDSQIVEQVLSNYAQYGLSFDVTQTKDTPDQNQRIPRQYETDLNLIQRLAQNNGFVFYIEPRTFGSNTAYWGPENRQTVPQPALTFNMGASSNTQSLHFSQDALAPINTQGTYIDSNTKSSNPVAPLPPSRVPLAQIPIPARRTVLLRNTAKQTSEQASNTATAAVTNAPQPVVGEGELETVRYGHILRARQLVGVRGVGLSYNGNFYVSQVTHSISRNAYTQRFTLEREGTGTLQPVVRV